MTRVFVSGMGVVSSLGFGHEIFFERLVAGTSAVSELTLFDTDNLSRSRAAEVKGFDPNAYLNPVEARRMGRASAYSVAATRMAVRDAGLGGDGAVSALAGERTSVVVGTTMGEANVLGELERAWIHEGADSIVRGKIPRYGSTLLPIHVARTVSARGLVQCLPAACAAGNYAIGFAADLIRAGRADAAVCGAVEVIEKLQYAGFVRLGAVSPDRCQPFDQNRQGLVVGEGAAMLVLESEARVDARGGKKLAEVGGYGLACDAHHITRPHPEGEGSIAAMWAALTASRITPDDVDHINAHGTGTAANDRVEAKVIREVFGDRPLPVTSIKSMIGHCMGASSAMEAVACIRTLQTGVIPPTIHYETPDPECPLDVVANQPRRAKVDVVLNNALAFGGYDAVLCLARPGVLPPATGQTVRLAKQGPSTPPVGESA